jgi:hypothetical protein
MSNLTRPTVDLLLNTLTEADFGHYLVGDVTTGAKHLILKKQGFDFVGANSSAIIKVAGTGQKMKRVLTPVWKWNGEATQLFEIEVTRQPLVTSVPEEQFPISHIYSFLMTGFVTTTPGSLHNDDKDAIIAGLIAAIAADTQIGPNQVLTGAVVIGTSVSQTLVLESLEVGKIFTVQTYDSQFTQPVLPTVGYMKDKLTNDEVARIFSIKEEHVGSRVNVPIAGVDYACITIKTTTQFVGIDLLGGTGQAVVQCLNIYTPVSQLAILISDLYAADGDNAKAMGTGSTVDSNIIELLEFVFGSANVVPNVIATAAIGNVTAPVKNAVPKLVVTETAEYTGTIAWAVTGGAALVGNFAAATLYTATVTLTPKAGKTLTGVDANFFTIAGGLAAATNAADSGVVTVDFAATAA